ncbi:MAG TPA: mandelate racemase/muconate lactonizing enzyme family protein [bacterium]|nr:mandelate racemase/muconate lactonizing enzyme family protein [bacterium]
MSKIDRIELFHVSVPLPAPFYPSWIPGFPQTHNRFTLIRLTTDDGLVGVSAGSAMSTERQGLGELIGGYLIGAPADDLVKARKLLREASYLGWRNWWIEAAIWDIIGQKENKPVYQLLQDKPEPVLRAKIYASTGEVRPFGRRTNYLDTIRDMGIEAIKIRVKDPERRDDISILRDVRRELGDDFTIAVDANQGWPVSVVAPTPEWDYDYALNFGKACDDLGIAWIEEPLDLLKWDDMAKLRRAVKTPIAGAELLGDFHEVRALLEHECLDMYQPDATFCGGLTTSKRIMDECRRRDLGFSPHTWTNGIGLMINLHAFAAWEKRRLLEYPFEPPGWIPQCREGVIAPLAVHADGTIDVPQTPGLGLNLDERRLKKFGTCFYVATPLRIAVKTVLEKGLVTALDLKRNKNG